MSGSLFRGLVLYLSVFMAFPPQVWTAAYAQPPAAPMPLPPAGGDKDKKDAPKDEPKKAPDAKAPDAKAPEKGVAAVEQNDRVPLRQAFHLASWRLTKTLKKLLPGARKLREDGYHAILEPYQHCADPFESAPESLAAVDELILAPAQKALGDFFQAHADEINGLSSVLDPEPHRAAPIELVESPVNKRRCQPGAWRPESTTVGAPGSPASWMAEAQKAAASFQEPFFIPLGKAKGPVTNTEIRRWIGWLYGLRDFRNLIARQFAMKAKKDGFDAAPLMKIPAGIGEKISNMFSAERADIVKGAAQQIMAGAGVGDAGYQKVPRFVLCDGKDGRPNDPASFCFVESTKPPGSDFKEDLMLRLQSEKGHGVELDTLRMLGTEGLMTELATVNTLLQKDAVPLEAACRKASDMTGLVNYYDTISKSDQKLFWVQQFGLAVDSEEKAYREGTKAIPVPRDEAFYREADKVVSAWIDAFFKENLIVVPSAKVGDPVHKFEDLRKKRLMNELSANPFRDRITEAPRSTGSDFPTLLSEKLKIWFALVQEDIGQLDEANRKAVITEMVREVVLYVLTDALEAHVLVVAAEEKLETAALGDLWTTRFRLRWQEALRSDAAKGSVYAMADAIAAGIFAHEALKKTPDGTSLADEALTQYVRKITPQVRHAAQAEDTVRFMTNLVQWKNGSGGPGNFFSALLPGPWNYNWQLAGWSWVGPVFKKEFLGGSPRFFQLDDGDGHGYGYTLTPPDPRMYDDGYLHIQGALRSVAERRRDQLIKRLQDRGYTDDMVRRMFTAQGARNTGVLADLILRKYGEVVDAQDFSDRGRYSDNKTKAYTVLLNWLKAPGARAAYEQETQRLARFILDRYLRALLDTADRSDTWKADLSALLKQIYENETYLKEPSVTAVTAAYDAYKKEVEEENKDSRWDELKAGLKALETETTEKTDVFEGPKEFADWCKAKKAECEAWDKKASAIWKDEDQVRGLFESRVVSATEKNLTDFLATWGRDGVLYDGTTPADVGKKAVLESVRESLFRAWVGWPREPRLIGHYRGQVEKLLKDASHRARTGKPIETAILIRKISSEVRTKVQDMFDIWDGEMIRRVRLVSDAIKSGDEKKLVAAQPEAVIVYFHDLKILSLQSPRRLAQALFEKALPDLLFVDFADFREALSQRIQVAIAPQPDPGKEIAKIDQRLKDLDDARWYLLNKSESSVRSLFNLDLETVFKKREDREEYKRIVKDIEFNEKRKEQLKDKLKALVELRRIVRNYLGEIAEAKAALAEDDSGRRNDELWVSYVNDQILMGLPTGKKGALVQKDISGKEMSMTPYRIIADLNDLSLAASRRLVVTGNVAKNFVTSVKDYCAAGALPQNASAFEKMYRAGLVAEFKQNVPMAKVLSTLIAGWVPFLMYSQMPALEPYRDRVKKLIALKPKAGLGATKFDEWFTELMKTAVSGDAETEKLLFESVPTGAEFCKQVTDKAAPLVAPIQEAIDKKKAVVDATLDQYWELVELASSILFMSHSRFAPLRAADKKVVWLESGPTFEMAPALVPAGGGAQIRERGVTEALLRFAELPKVDAVVWKKIFDGMPEPKSASVDDRAAWVMGLHGAERRTAFAKLQTKFESAVKKEAAAVLAPVFQAEEAPCLGLPEWHSTLRKHFLHWDRIKERLRAFAPPPPIRTAHTAGNAVGMGALPGIGPLNLAGALLAPPPGLPVEAPQPKGSAHLITREPEFKDLAKATFRLFVQYTPYRLEENRLVLKPVPADLNATLAAFDKATPEVQRRIVEDAEDLYNVEVRSVATRIMTAKSEDEASQELPWRELYHRVRRPGACKMNVSGEEALLAFFGNSFVVDPADEINYQVKSAGIEEWKRHYQVRIGFNQRAGYVDLMPFVFDYNMKAGGTNHVSRMESWLKLWGANPKVAQQIKTLRALPKNPNAQPRLWDSFETIEAFQKSDLYTQLTGLLRRHDYNSEAGFAPRTYQYFLATLNWNINHYGIEPPIGPTAQAMAPGEFLLGKLLGDLVAVMNLEMNNVAGWEKLLTVTGKAEDAQPEDWLLIAQSRRNTLVGAGERRFLGTMVEAPYSVNPNWVGANHSYRPFPIVDLSERTSFGTDRGFDEWYARTEHPSLHQLYRVSASDEEKRPVYENIVAIQGELIGEMDLQDGLATRRERFTKASADWEKHTFGNVQFTKARVDGLVARANNAGLKTGDTEMRLLLGTREALADFRRTLSELNLKYEHESFRWAQGRGNDILTNGLFIRDLEKAMEIFTKQMGSDEKAPRLPAFDPHADKSTLSKKRREYIARAIFWAGNVAKNRVFAGKTKEEKDRLKAVVTIIDAFYLEEGQKVEVRRGLRAVAGNINKQLKSLCEAQNLRNITSDDELRKARKLVVEDTRLVYMDNLAQIMYFDSGLVEDGKNSQVRRILNEMSRDLTASKQFANDVNTAVLWLVALSVMVLAFGYMNPALARVAFAPKAVQAGIYIVGMAAATGFAYIEIYQICEDFWGRPGEIELLTQIRDTHFTGRNPLMKDETGVHLGDARRLNLADQRSLMRWTFHVLGIIAGIQVMAQAYKLARGGVAWALAKRNPMRPVEFRFRGHTVTLELAEGTGGAFATIDGRPLAELEGKLLEAYTKALGGTRGAGNTILIDEATMSELRKWAKAELDNLCRELNLNPRTLLPNDMPVDVSKMASWDPRRLAYEAQEAARAQSMPQLRWLQGMAQRPTANSHALTTPELVRLAALGGEPAMLFTPWYMTLFGLTNRSAMVRRFEKLRLIAQAEIDIMAVHSPQTLQILAFLQELNLGKTAVQKWELFTEALYTRITTMPSDLRSYFQELYRQAGIKADQYIARLRTEGRLDGMDPAQIELKRIEYIRGCFDDVFRYAGATTDASRVDLVDMFHKQLKELLLPKYGHRTFAYFQMHFLREKKLAMDPGALLRRETLNEMILWQQRAQEVVRRYAAEQGASESDVLYWMLNESHPKYREFRTSRPARNGDGSVPSAEAEPWAYGTEFPSATASETVPVPTVYDIHRAATELRDLMRHGNTVHGSWLIDMELCRAIAAADYRAMASRLIRVRRVSAGGPAEPVRPEAELEDFRPLDDRLPTRPDPTEAPIVSGPGSSAAVDELAFGGVVRDSDALLARVRGVVPADSWDAVSALLKRHGDVTSLMYEMGGKRALGQLDEAALKAYRLAIAVRQELQRAASIANEVTREAFIASALNYLRRLGAGANWEISVVEARGILGLSPNGWSTIAEIDAAARKAFEKGVDGKLIDQALRCLKSTHPELRNNMNPEVWARVFNVPMEHLTDPHVALRARTGASGNRSPIEELYARLYGTGFEANGAEARRLLGLSDLATPDEIAERARRLTAEIERLITRAPNEATKDIHRAAIRRIEEARRLATADLVAPAYARALRYIREMQFGATGRDPETVMARIQAIVPAEMWGDVAQLLQRHPRAFTMMYELGVRRGFNRCSAALEQRYRLAIAIRQELQRMAGIAAPADQELYLRSALQYLRGTNTITNLEMSVGEARGVLGLPMTDWPAFLELDRVAREAIALGKQESVVNRALLVLQMTHPEARDLANPEVWCRILNMPLEALANQHVIRAMALRGPGRLSGPDVVIEDMVLRLFGETFAANAREGRLLLGLTETANERAVWERMQRLVTELERCIEETTSPGAKAMYRTALHRVRQSHQLVIDEARTLAAASRPVPPVRPVATPQERLPEFGDMQPIDLAREPYFEGMWRQLVQDEILVRRTTMSADELSGAVIRAMQEDLGTLRLDHLRNLIDGRVAWSGEVSFHERLMRAMHAASFVRHARTRGALVRHETVQRVLDIMMRHYVNAGRLRFSMSISEAEEFIYLTFRKLNPAITRDQIKLYSEGRLPELRRYIATQRRAHGAKPVDRPSILGDFELLPEAHLNRLEEAYEIVMAGNISPSHKDLAAELEALIFEVRAHRLGTNYIITTQGRNYINMRPDTINLRSAGQMPMEVILALCREARVNPKAANEIRRFIYMLVDQGHGYRVGTDWGHAYGDMIWWMFGPEGVRMPTALDESNGRFIAHQLVDWLRFAIKNNDVQMMEDLVRAAQKVPGIEVPPDALPIRGLPPPDVNPGPATR